jgi:hypothetical protein
MPFRPSVVRSDPSRKGFDWIRQSGSEKGVGAEEKQAEDLYWNARFDDDAEMPMVDVDAGRGW